jgi:hypothetical protein
MRSWGISRPCRHLKRRLTTQTGEISPEGGDRTAACSSGSGTGENARGFVSEAQSLPIGHGGEIVLTSTFVISGFAFQVLP